MPIAGCAHLFNLRAESVEVDKQIDARIRERRHAALVVGLGVHMVHTDGIRAQLGHFGDIALALGGIDEGIVWGELIGDA